MIRSSGLRRGGRSRRGSQAAAAVLLAALTAVAAYLWTAPRRAEEALKRAPEHVLRTRTEQDPGDPRPFYYLGLRLQEAGDREAAHQAFLRAAALDASDEAGWLAAAATASAPEEAFRILSLFASQNPGSAAGHLALARFCLGDGRQQAAFDAASAAVRLDPRSAEGWRIRGLAALAQRHTPDAESSLRRAVALDAGDWQARVGLAGILLFMSPEPKSEEALSLYREAVRLAPDQPSARRALGEALLTVAAGPAEFEAAGETLARAAEMEPDDPRVFLLLGQAYNGQRRWKDARDALLRARRRTPLDQNVAFELARAYEGLGDRKAAAREAERRKTLKAYADEKFRLMTIANEEAGNDQQARLKLARLCAAHGETAEAVSHYRQALAHAPGLQAARRELAALEARPADARPDGNGR